MHIIIIDIDNFLVSELFCFILANVFIIICTSMQITAKFRWNNLIFRKVTTPVRKLYE